MGIPTVYYDNEAPAEIMRYGLTIAEDLIPTLPPASLDTGEIIAYFDALANSLNTAIYNSHLNDIQNGGYGLDPTDEDALWQREREREEVVTQSNLDEVKRNYSMSGFPIPPGSMKKAMDRAVQMSTEKLSSVNRDISLKRADLYMRGKEFALTGGLTTNQQLLAKVSDLSKIHAQLDQVSVEMRARIIAAALSMMNLNTSIATHEAINRSENWNHSDSVQKSTSTTTHTSTSINHNYNFHI